MVNVHFSSRRTAGRTPRSVLGGGLLATAFTALALSAPASKAAVVAPEVLAPTVVTPKVVTPQAGNSAANSTSAPAPASAPPSKSQASPSAAPAAAPTRSAGPTPSRSGQGSGGAVSDDEGEVIVEDLRPRRTREADTVRELDRKYAYLVQMDFEDFLRDVILPQVGFGPKAPSTPPPATYDPFKGSPDVIGGGAIQAPLAQDPADPVSEELVAVLGALLGKGAILNALDGYDTTKAQ
jgi:hypothetical protein